jgi:hypothetical protein
MEYRISRVRSQSCILDIIYVGEERILHAHIIAKGIAIRDVIIFCFKVSI